MDAKPPYLLTADELFALDGEIGGYELLDGKLCPAPRLFAPDLAIEVATPEKSEEELRLRVILHLQGGSKQVWLVRPERQTVTIYSMGEPGRTLNNDETLDGGEVLPGFSLPVKALFRRA
ncbi:MAG: Uma2 family endonuclease [Microbacterium sp.]|nr:Uma2 family endonuclease [Microbacterium sp.]